MSGLKINSNVTSASDLKLPVVNGIGSGTPDVLNRIHRMARASHTSNLWSIPTDCKSDLDSRVLRGLAQPDRVGDRPAEGAARVDR